MGSRERKIDRTACHVDVEGDVRFTFGSAFEDVLEIVVDSLHQDRNG